MNALAVQSILVRLPLAPGITALDALRACDIKRKGDICTAIPESIYVFLFACREGDVDLALDHIFTLPIDVLFEGQLRFPIPTTIEHGLNDLAHFLNTSAVPDYADELNVPASYGTLAANFLLESPHFDRTPPPGGPTSLQNPPRCLNHPTSPPHSIIIPVFGAWGDGAPILLASYSSTGTVISAFTRWKIYCSPFSLPLHHGAGYGVGSRG